MFVKDAVRDKVSRFWFRWFRSGNEGTEDEQHQSRPETYTNEGIKQYLVQNPPETCLEVCQSLKWYESINKENKRFHPINLIELLCK